MLQCGKRDPAIDRALQIGCVLQPAGEDTGGKGISRTDPVYDPRQHTLIALGGSLSAVDPRDDAMGGAVLYVARRAGYRREIGKLLQ